MSAGLQDMARMDLAALVAERGALSARLDGVLGEIVEVSRGLAMLEAHGGGLSLSPLPLLQEEPPGAKKETAKVAVTRKTVATLSIQPGKTSAKGHKHAPEGPKKEAEAGLTCLIDKGSFYDLGQHLRKVHGITAREYRQRFDLPADSPMRMDRVSRPTQEQETKVAKPPVERPREHPQAQKPETKKSVERRRTPAGNKIPPHRDPDLYRKVRELTDVPDRQNLIRKVLAARKTPMTSREVTEGFLSEIGKSTEDRVVMMEATSRIGVALHTMSLKGDVVRKGDDYRRKWALSEPARKRK